MDGLINYKFEKLDSIAITRLANELAQALAHDVMKMTEQQRIDLFYNVLLETDSQTIKAYWVDYVAPYTD